MEIQRIDSYTDPRFPQEVLYQHGAFLVDGAPWTFRVISDHEAEVAGEGLNRETLAEAAVGFARSLGKCRLLNLCPGSGGIGLAVAANAPDCRALLGDISEEALGVCRRNVRRCGLADRVKAEVLDLLAPPPEAIGLFDCITCNPPYITRGEMEALDRSVKDFEPHLALCGGEDGLDFYRAAVKNWKNALTEKGRLYFEVGAGQADQVRRLMAGEGFADINILPDTQGIGRVVYGTRNHEKEAVV